MADQEQSPEQSVEDIYEQNASDGLQNVRAEDLTTPFIMILQSNSPQVQDGNPKRIKGVSAGMFINTVTGEIFDMEEGFYFVQTGFVKKLVEWAPRKAGGGLKGSYPVDHPVRNNVTPTVNSEGKTELKLPNGNLIVETAYHFGYHVGAKEVEVGKGKDKTTELEYDFENAQQAVISLTSTALKCSRLLMSQFSTLKMKGANGLFTPPTYSRVIHFTSKLLTRDNNSWYTWEFNIKDPVTDRDFVVNQAIPMSDSINKGQLEVGAPTGAYAQLEDHSQQEVPDADADDGEPKSMEDGAKF